MAFVGKKIRLPKKIAGVKIPKSLRKSNLSLAGLLKTPEGRETVAGVLTAVAGALLTDRHTRHAVANAGHEVAKTGAQATSATGNIVRDVADMATGVVAKAVHHAISPSPSGSPQPSSGPSEPAPSGRGARGKAADGSTDYKPVEHSPVAADRKGGSEGEKHSKH